MAVNGTDLWCPGMLGVPCLALFILGPVGKSDAPFLKEILASLTFGDFIVQLFRHYPPICSPRKNKSPPSPPVAVMALKSATCGEGLLHAFVLLPESFGGLVTAASLPGTWEG